MAHTPKCLPRVGMVETVVLPKSATRDVPAGASTTVPLTVPRGGVLVVTAEGGGATLILRGLEAASTGGLIGREWRVNVRAGCTRIMVPDEIAEAVINAFNTSQPVTFWLESDVEVSTNPRDAAADW